MGTLTNTYIDQVRDEFTEHYNETIRAVRQYDEGDHTRMITARQQRQLFGRDMQTMADNVVRLILNVTASRLTFEEWDVDEAQIDDDGAPDLDNLDAMEESGEVKAWLDDLYLRNRLRARQFDVHRAMLRDGDHAVALVYRRGRVRVLRERWWDGESGVFVAYDSDGEPAFAVKEWVHRDPETGAETPRRNVYYPDHFQRFYREGTGWQPITDRNPDTPDEEQLNDGTVRWEKAPGDPLGIPIVHFANGSRADTPYGASAVAGLLGLQDEVNAAQHDIAAASKYTGFQMFWSKKTNTRGKLQVGPGQLLEFDDPDAEFHAIPAGDIGSLMDAHGYKRKTMMLDAETPMHEIEGAQWPSGEAILNMDRPLINKVTRLGAIVGPAWTTIGHRATEIANTFEGLALDEDAPIRAILGDPRQLDELTLARTQLEQARVMETVSRISDLTLIEQLGFLDAKTLLKLRAERESRYETVGQMGGLE